MSIVTLKVSVSAGVHPIDACRDLCETADRLRLTLETEMNEVHCVVFPGGSPDILYSQYKEAFSSAFPCITNKE